MFSKQLNKCRQEYEDQLQKLRSRIEELEQWNANQQGLDLRFQQETSFEFVFFLFRRRIKKINRSSKRSSRFFVEQNFYLKSSFSILL